MNTVVSDNDRLVIKKNIADFMQEKLYNSQDIEKINGLIH
jgi:hypothetical protein